MGVDFGGVSSLAQASLALNMAYLALEKFQYRPEVQRILLNAHEMLKGADSSTDTMAHENLKKLLEGNRQGWGDNWLSGLVYVHLLLPERDRKLCKFFSIISIMWILYHGIYALFEFSSCSYCSYNTPFLVRAIFMLVMISALCWPAAMWPLGNRVTGSAKMIVDKCASHIGRSRRSQAITTTKNFSLH
ncbi:MAG: hypothetical protein KDG89_14505 [Geminicoccaceae bacterium]|nr:hypothetical protein [Geminicoccaceae bacterium]